MFKEQQGDQCGQSGGSKDVEGDEEGETCRGSVVDISNPVKLSRYATSSSSGIVPQLPRDVYQQQ